MPMALAARQVDASRIRSLDDRERVLALLAMAWVHPVLGRVKEHISAALPAGATDEELESVYDCALQSQSADNICSCTSFSKLLDAPQNHRRPSIHILQPSDHKRLIRDTGGPGFSISGSARPLTEGFPTILGRATDAEEHGMEYMVPLTLIRWLLPESITSNTWAVRYKRTCVRRARVEQWAATWRVTAAYVIKGRQAEIKAPLLAVGGTPNASTSPEMVKKVVQDTPRGRYAGDGASGKVSKDSRRVQGGCGRWTGLKEYQEMSCAT